MNLPSPGYVNVELALLAGMAGSVDARRGGAGALPFLSAGGACTMPAGDFP
jgi:hypothetical protein